MPDDQPWLHPKLRTRFTAAVCNWLLNNVAEDWYRTVVAGSYRVGFDKIANDALEDLLQEAGPGARFMALHEVPTDGTWAIYQTKDKRFGRWLQYTEKHHLASSFNEGSGTMVVVRPWEGPDLDTDDPLNMVEM